MPKSESASPGHSMPSPSADQKTPNVVSIAPTPNFIVFSGTWVRGCLSATPSPITTTPATMAPQIAALMADAPPAPKAMTMNATSRPSRSTDLYEMTVPTQSHSFLRRPWARSSATSRW